MLNKVIVLLELIGLGLLLVAAMYYFLPAQELPHFLPGFDPKSTLTHTKEALYCLLGGVALFIISFVSGKIIE